MKLHFFSNLRWVYFLNATRPTFMYEYLRLQPHQQLRRDTSATRAKLIISNAMCRRCHYHHYQHTHKHTFQTGLTVINDKIWKRWCLLSRIISESSVMCHRLHRTGWTPTLVHYESFHLLRINDYVQGICVIFCSLALIALKSLRLNERTNWIDSYFICCACQQDLIYKWLWNIMEFYAFEWIEKKNGFILWKDNKNAFSSCG